MLASKISKNQLQIPAVLLLLSLLSVLPYDTHAQTLHNQTLDTIVKQRSVFKGSAQIGVGADPVSMACCPENTIFVANSGSDTVSVISTSNNTKVKDIPVGQQVILY